MGEDDFELVDLSMEASWSNERKQDYKRLMVIAARVERTGVDITSTDPSDLFHVAQVCRLFDPKGEELFLRICCNRPVFNEIDLKLFYNTEKSKKPYKTISKVTALCKDHDVSYRITKKEPEQRDSPINFLPDDADESAADDLEEYGFFSMKNRYYHMVKGASGFECKAFTTFTMKVLFHMNNGDSPRRVIELINYRKEKRVIDVETTQLSSTGKFVELVEGLGRFLFEGTPQLLNAIKRKVFDEEGNCTQLSNLGWMEDERIWVWGNGVFIPPPVELPEGARKVEAKYVKADDQGFVMDGDENYYLASANKSTKGRKHMFANHMKFSCKISEKVNFQNWTRHYFQVYGLIGMPVMLHAMSCLFSDIIFEAMGNGFPILFIYGEGGSGKSSSIKSAQRLFGNPQDPLKLSGSNTDKSKIRTFAQFINSMIFLDEYVNNEVIDELLKGLYDRYGYKRATKDSSYNTETVPIQSGVAVAGNYIPYNEPLITRLIFLTNHKNMYSDQEKKNHAWFDDWSQKGSCQVTHSLIQHRQYVEDNYKVLHRENVRRIMTMKESKESVSRMIDNFSVPLTMYDIITNLGLKLPFKKQVLEGFLLKSLTEQNVLRNNDNDYAHFWVVCGSLIGQGKMKYNDHYKLDGEELYILMGLLWPLWMQEYYSIYRKAPAGKGTMLSKLENKSRGFITHFKSARVGNHNSSGTKFSIKLLPSDFADQVQTAMAHSTGMPKDDGLLPTNPTEGFLGGAKGDKDPF